MLLRYLYSRLIIAPDFWKCQNLLIDLAHIYGREAEIIKGVTIDEFLRKMDKSFLPYLYSRPTLKEMQEEHKMIRELIKQFQHTKKGIN
jgi:hypothetical protein